MPGPLPDPNRRRRNAPTIPATSLSAAGRTDPAPEVPSWCELGQAGLAWWRWAWATPQALAWGTEVGMEAWVARRASLEDDLAALHAVEGLDFIELGSDQPEREFRMVVQRVAAMATGRLAILKEMREMYDRLGLTPKGMAQLRWTIVAAPTEDQAKASQKKAGGNVTSMESRRKRVASDAS